MPTPPHILLITMDECRVDALSCYGGMGVATPHMDALAREGVRFTSAFAPSPVCLPSRCALLLGRYPHHNGMNGNDTARRIDPRTPSLFNTLRESGYYVAKVGKCHLSGLPYKSLKYGVPRDDPSVREYLLSLGLDHLSLADDKNGSMWYWDDYSRDLRDAGLFEKVAHPGTPYHARTFPVGSEWQQDAWIGRRGVAELERHDGSRPVFLWASFSGPHHPHDPGAEYLPRVDTSRLPLLTYREGEFDAGDKAQCNAFRRPPGFRGPDGQYYGCEGGVRDGGTSTLTREDWIAIQQHYLANVAQIDDHVGALVRTARARLGDNLLVILTADHGDMMGAHRLWGKNACTYDEVLRIPFIVAGAGFSGGKTSDARVGLIDILPTVRRVLGREQLPDTDGRPLDQSLADGGREILYSSNEHLVAVHDRRWRLAIDERANTIELYDRASDPGEHDNLATRPEGREARARLEPLARAVLEHQRKHWPRVEAV